MESTVLYVVHTIHKDQASIELRVTRRRQYRKTRVQTNQDPLDNLISEKQVHLRQKKL